MDTLNAQTPTFYEILDFLQRPAQASPKTRQSTSTAHPATVTAIAVTSIDGRGAIAGTSGALGNDTDATIFNTLRALSDVVFVGTGTIVSEDYGPIHIPQQLRSQRRKLGRAHNVVMATLSRSLELRPDSDFFANAAANPPIIFTHSERDAKSVEDEIEHVAKIQAMEAAGARVVKLEEPTVEAALDWLKRGGFVDIVCEGGPTMYREAFAHNCVDELFLTLSPTWVGSGPLTFGDNASDPQSGLDSSCEASDSAPRINPQGFELCRILRADSHLFLRYSRTSTR